MTPGEKIEIYIGEVAAIRLLKLLQLHGKFMINGELDEQDGDDYHDLQLQLEHILPF